MQMRMTAAELAVAQLRAEMNGVSGDVSQIRAALLAAVDSEPALPGACSGAECNPAIEATGDTRIEIRAPRGQIAIESDACGVDDLCASAAFAAALKEALRTVPR